MASTVYLKSVFVVLFYIFVSVTSQEFVKTADNFGPYIPKWKDYYACQGPKSKNLANFTTELRFENNCYNAVMNFSFPANSLMTDLKMEVFTIKNNQKYLLWNYRVNKPCQHFAIKEVLERMFRVHQCVFPKGESFFVVNLTEACYMYLGNSFFYGEFTFKMTAFNKKGNLACLLFHPVFTKKT